MWLQLRLTGQSTCPAPAPHLARNDCVLSRVVPVAMCCDLVSRRRPKLAQLDNPCHFAILHPFIYCPNWFKFSHVANPHSSSCRILFWVLFMVKATSRRAYCHNLWTAWFLVSLGCSTCWEYAAICSRHWWSIQHWRSLMRSCLLICLIPASFEIEGSPQINHRVKRACPEQTRDTCNPSGPWSAVVKHAWPCLDYDPQHNQ